MSVSESSAWKAALKDGDRGRCLACNESSPLIEWRRGKAWADCHVVRCPVCSAGTRAVDTIAPPFFVVDGDLCDNCDGDSRDGSGYCFQCLGVGRVSPQVAAARMQRLRREAGFTLDGTQNGV